MKALFCTYDRPGYVGGPNAGLRRLLPALRERGIEAECLLLTFGDVRACPTLNALHRSGVPCQHAPYHATTEERVRWILSAVQQRPPAVFIPNIVPAAYYAAMHLKRRGIRCIGVLRSDDGFHRQLAQLFLRTAPDRAMDAWVAVSDHLVRMVEQHTPCVVQIPSSAVFPHDDFLPRMHPDQPLRILYSGRLAETQKRISLVTRSLCRLTQNLPDTQATMAGNGPQREEVQAILAAHPNARVTLLPPQDSANMPALLRTHHAVLLMSEYEGMPLCLLEGMAHGLVPLSTPVASGVPELIRHGETGFLLHEPERNLEEAARALRDPHTFARLSRNARDLVRERFSPDACADAWAHLIATQGAAGRPQPVRMPVRLCLPPPVGIREDDRATPFQALKAAATSLLPVHQPFLHPRCRPGFVDLYTVRRSILAALTHTLPLFRGTVVDMGAGCAPYRTLFLDAPAVTRYLTADMPQGAYGPDTLQDTPPPWDMAWDGRTLPMQPGKAGAVVLTEVLEHCPDPARVLAEAHRILTPGGLIFLTVPFLWPLHDVPCDAYRYTPWTLERLLQSTGFADVQVRPLGGFDAAMAQMLGLYIRRRSRQSGYLRFLRPLLSFAAAPVVRLLTALDKPPSHFHEGLMCSGLWATARKAPSAPCTGEGTPQAQALHGAGGVVSPLPEACVAATPEQS